jgi:AraC-like DNA-binding protein
MMIGTKGIIYYTDYCMPINYYKDEKALYSTNQSGCYRILFIEDGIGNMLVNKKRVSILPFTLFCLNETDCIEAMEMEGKRIHLLCFLPSAVNNRLTIENMHSDDCLTISDSQDKMFLKPFMNKDKAQKEGICLSADTGRRLNEILADLKGQLFVQNDSWPCLTRSYLIELLFLIQRTNYGEYAKKESNKAVFAIDDVIHYIHNNYMDKVTISDLAKRFNTNRTTLSKEFKITTDESVISYLIKIRIQVAASMLRDTELKVAVIIERVGFKNVTHFNKVFRGYTHCLPKEYRKKYKSEY